MDLTGQLALVSGGGSGMGRAIAHAFANEGMRVAIIGRTEAKLHETVNSYPGTRGELAAKAVDVADRAQVERFAASLHARFGPVSILVNSAGINIPRRRVEVLDPADFERVVQVNLNGAFYLMHAVLPGMRANGGGLIINISSISGVRPLVLAGAAYAASKFALNALSSVVSQEEAQHNIRCTAICPGEVNTPILEMRPEPVSEERKALMLQPEDIAAAALMVAKLPPRAHVPEMIIKPTLQIIP